MNERGEALFIKRSMAKKTLPGAYSFPSGTMEPGETPFQTTVREGQEELGVTLSPQKILVEKELPELKVKLIFVICAVKEGEGIPSVKDFGEIESFTWMRFDEFFRKYSDDQIGHGLIWLRTQPKLWERLSLASANRG